MLQEETLQFLKNVAPFNLLPEEEVEGIIGDIGLDYYPKGALILTQGGSPSSSLYIIKRGGVKVSMTSESGEEIVLDYRSEGEHFGLLSLVSGDRSRTNVMAVEDTISFLIPKGKLLPLLQRNPTVNEYFLKSFFINFIDKTHEETRKKFSGASTGDRAIFTTPVGNVVRRKPVTAVEDTTIREAAQVMAQHKISSLIIVDEAAVPVGIITDRDLREKVVARGLELHHPARMIMSSPLIKVDAGEYCFEALLKMMRYNIHHILVVEDGRFKGILTNHDFMVLQGSSPVVLVKEVEEIVNLDGLETTMPKVNRMVSNLFREGAKAHNVTGIITELSEKLLNRVFSLAEHKLGPPPLNYALFLFDEGGRRELTLNPALRMGIIYADSANDRTVGETEKFFQELKKILADSLPSCYPAAGRECVDSRHIMAQNQWRELIDRWADAPERYRPRGEFVDMRTIRGDRELVEPLRRHLMGLLDSHDAMMDAVMKEALANRPPLGFFRRFVVEKSGEHRSELNLYEKGIKPLVEVVRIFAVQRGVEHFSTWRRVSELRSRFSFAHTGDIEQALEYLLTLLIHHQLEKIENGKEADNFINPARLADIEKKTLKETFHLTGTLYDIIEKSLSAEVVES